MKIKIRLIIERVTIILFIFTPILAQTKPKYIRKI